MRHREKFIKLNYTNEEYGIRTQIECGYEVELTERETGEFSLFNEVVDDTSSTYSTFEDMIADVKKYATREIIKKYRVDLCHIVSVYDTNMNCFVTSSHLIAELQDNDTLELVDD